jgi:hypothetical protein
MPKAAKPPKLTPAPVWPTSIDKDKVVLRMAGLEDCKHEYAQTFTDTVAFNVCRHCGRYYAAAVPPAQLPEHTT